MTLEEVVTRPLFAHLATLSPQGPRESPVWFLWEDQELWIIADASSSFHKRIENDARSAVGIVHFDAVEGTVQHVGFRGEAFVEPWDSSRAVRLLRKYLGPDTNRWPERFKETCGDDSKRWVRFVPSSTVIRDQSYGPGPFQPMDCEAG